MDLVELLKRPEGKTLEFKRELSAPEGALRTIVAFANSAGGTLLVGVEDRSGHVRGVTEPLDLEERIANGRQECGQTVLGYRFSFAMGPIPRSLLRLGGMRS